MFQVSYRRLYLPISNQSSLDLRLAIAKGERVGGGVEQEIGVSRCYLLYIGCINDKVLLHGTENHTQYPVINHHGK